MPIDTSIDPRFDPRSDPPIDPRGQRFAAAVTTVVLAVVLLSSSVWLLAAQALVFATGAMAGPRRSPYALAFRFLVRPRLGPPQHTEASAPPRFAQAVGLGFSLVGLTGFLVGAPAVGLVATAFAFVAAFLNAAFGLCLGCELYLLVRRTFPDRHTDRASSPTEVSA